jgi:hypothetical protein
MVMKRSQFGCEERPSEGARLHVQAELLRPRPCEMHLDPQDTADARMAGTEWASIFAMSRTDELPPPRPRCSECDMRMVSRAGRHECLRCGNVQRKPKA